MEHRIIIMFFAAIQVCLMQSGTANMCTNEMLVESIVPKKLFLGRQILNLTAEGVMQCSRFCLYRRICQSFNYDTLTGGCQVNTDTPVDPSQLITAARFIFSDINTWPRGLAGVCKDHTCPLNSRCDPFDDVVYNCIVEHCLGVPVVENGILQSDDEVTMFGSIMDINCNQGYLPESEVICQNNGTWSRGVCVALTSCNVVKQLQPASEDGEYWLLLVNKTYFEKIYCHMMSSENPKEFLTLKYLNHGSYPRMSNLACTEETELVYNCIGEGGEIWFNKIRVYVNGANSLEVDIDDQTFANVSNVGDWLNFGQAVDCYTTHPYNTASCGVKGTFTIDLRGTGWRIHERQQWETFGWKAFMYPVQRELNGTVISLNCGGVRGGCRPVGGLFLTPYPGGRS